MKSDGECMMVKNSGCMVALINSHLRPPFLLLLPLMRKKYNIKLIHNKTFFQIFMVNRQRSRTFPLINIQVCISTETPKNINFPFEANGKLILLGVLILTHIMLIPNLTCVTYNTFFHFQSLII